MGTQLNRRIIDSGAARELALQVLCGAGWREDEEGQAVLVRVFGVSTGAHRALLSVDDDPQGGVLIQAVVTTANGAQTLRPASIRIPPGGTMNQICDTAATFVRTLLRALAQHMARQVLMHQEGQTR